MSNVIKARRVVSVAGESEIRAPSRKEEEPTTNTSPTTNSSAATLSSAARSFLNEAPLLEHVRRKSEKLLQAASSDANAIVQEAEKRRDDLIEQFRQEGFAAGFEEGAKEGRTAGREELQRHRAVLAAAAEAAQDLREQLLRQHFEDVVELALQAAAKLMRRAGGMDRDTARTLLEEMLPRAVGAEKVVVRLAEADLALLEPELDALAEGAGQGTAVEFVADPRLRSGDVAVETDGGTLDGTASVRARRLVQQLLDVIDYGGQ